ncbi:hypothetical protein RI367_000399 [Sorochytrium milnesiophthora]
MTLATTTNANSSTADAIAKEVGAISPRRAAIKRKVVPSYTVNAPDGEGAASASSATRRDLAAEVEEGKVQNIVQEFSSRQTPSGLPPRPTVVASSRPSPSQSPPYQHPASYATQTIMSARSPRRVEFDNELNTPFHAPSNNSSNSNLSATRSYRRSPSVSSTKGSRRPMSELTGDPQEQQHVDTAVDQQSVISGCDSSTHSARPYLPEAPLTPTSVVDQAAATARSVFMKSKSFFEYQANQDDQEINRKVQHERRLLEIAYQRQCHDMKHVQHLERQCVSTSRENDRLQQELKTYRDEVSSIARKKEQEIKDLRGSWYFSIVSKLETTIRGELKDIKEQHTAKISQVTSQFDGIVLKNRALSEQLRWFNVTPITEIPNGLSQFTFWPNIDERRREIESQAAGIASNFVNQLHTMDLALQQLQDTTCHLARVVSKVPPRVRVLDQGSDHISQAVTVAGLEEYWSSLQQEEEEHAAIRKQYQELHAQYKKAESERLDREKLAAAVATVSPPTASPPALTPTELAELPRENKPAATVVPLVPKRESTSSSSSIDVKSSVGDLALPQALSEVGARVGSQSSDIVDFSKPEPPLRAEEKVAVAWPPPPQPDLKMDLKLDFGGDNLLDGLLDFL